MRIMPIASGSSGNCIYIGSDSTNILLDAGISRKRIVDGLKAINVNISDVSAVFVTHEHSDHIQGLGVLSRRDKIPVYSSAGTIDGIKNASSLGKIDNELLNVIEADKDFVLGDLVIKPFRISHDANEPVAYSVRMFADDKYKKISVVTDLGNFNDYTINNISNSDVILVEANHDISMLQLGPYPYSLKQRILSDKGHLSNESSGQLIINSLHDNLKKIYLGHLSKENNYDRLAYEAVKVEIDMSDNSYKSADFNIEVANRTTASSLFEF